MPKKRTAKKLIDRNVKLYAVLSPGTGYLKVDGDPYFYDGLPRASGCFFDEGDAMQALQDARKILKASLDEAKLKLVGMDEYIKMDQRRYDDAMRAIVVELSFKPLGKWIDPPAKTPKAPMAPVAIRVSRFDPLKMLGVADEDDDE